MYVACLPQMWQILVETVDLCPHYAQRCWHAVITHVGTLVTVTHMSVRGDNTTPISNDGVA